MARDEAIWLSVKWLPRSKEGLTIAIPGIDGALPSCRLLRRQAVPHPAAVGRGLIHYGFVALPGMAQIGWELLPIGAMKTFALTQHALRKGGEEPRTSCQAGPEPGDIDLSGE
jgi:hypothetical protein